MTALAHAALAGRIGRTDSRADPHPHVLTRVDLARRLTDGFSAGRAAVSGDRGERAE